MLTSSIILGLLLALVRRGDLRRLASLQMRWWWLIVGAFLLKFAVVRLSSEGVSWMATAGPTLHILVYGIISLPLFLNRGLPGMRLVVAGTLLNFVVIVANQGRMPVLETAVVLAGKAHTLDRLRAGIVAIHTVVTPETALPWLGDWIPVPFPLASVVSPGDVLLAVGVILLINTVTQPAYGRAASQA